MNVHVGLTRDALDVTSIIELVRSPAAGAIVTFSGTTRDHFQGRQVTYLEYDAYDAMASNSLASICQQAIEKWDLQGAACFHRLGRVDVGEESLIIAVSSAHRRAGWEAGEWILEQVKRETEIWKKEFYADGADTEAIWKANEEFARARKLKKSFD